MYGRGRGYGREHYLQAERGPSREAPCLICGKHNHWRRDCPRKKNHRIKKKKKRIILSAPPTMNIKRKINVRVNVVITCDTTDKDDLKLNTEPKEVDSNNEFIYFNNEDGAT